MLALAPHYKLKDQNVSKHPTAGFDRDGSIYEILLMFYTPQDKDHYVNHIVSRMSPPFSHVEFGFPTYTHTQDKLLATYNPLLQNQNPGSTRILYGSSIFQDGTVFFQKKEYSREGYTSIGLRLNRLKHDALIQYCQNAAAQKVPFGATEMYFAFLPIVLLPHNNNTTFCSKYITDALKYAGIKEVLEIDSRNTTPSSLYHHIRKHLRDYTIITASPYKLRSFKSIGRNGANLALTHTERANVNENKNAKKNHAESA